jgi:nitrate/TMAO reductase-like tetraheme cytochrome c subunit
MNLNNSNDLTNDGKASARKVAHEFAENRMTEDEKWEAEKRHLAKEMMEQLEDYEQSQSCNRGM